MQERIIKLINVEKLGVKRFVFGGINWWPLLRIYSCQPTPNHDHSIDHSISKLSYPNRLVWELKNVRKYRGLIKENRRSFKVQKNSRIVFGAEDHFVKKNEEIQFKNRYIGDLFDLIDENKHFVITGAVDPSKDYKPKQHSIFNNYLFRVRKRKAVRNFFRILFFKGETLEFVKKYKNEIDVIFNILRDSGFENIDRAELDRWIRIVNETYRASILLLKDLKPKELIQYCYYFPVQFGVTLAGNELGISTVDYQHGSQNNWHYAYGSWTNVPKEGYKLLPKEFWVFTDKEKKHLNSYFLETPHKALVKGNAAIKKYLSQNNAKLDWVEYLRVNKDKKIVLFTSSSYTFSKDHFLWDFLKSSAAENIFILVRLHPLHKHLENDYIGLFDNCNFKDYEIQKSTEENLFSLLESVDIHMTMASMVAEDALHFGLNTIVLDADWEIYFEDYFASKKMFLPKSVDELSGLIEKL